MLCVKKHRPREAAGENPSQDDSQVEGKGQGHDVQMERSVGLVSGVGLIVGTIIGSGIFISPKGVMEGCGSVAVTLLLWVVCGLLSTLGALVYAELGSSIPSSGGEHAYLMYTFHHATPGSPPRRGACGRIPAFLYDWVGLLVIRPTMFCAVSLALGTYAVKPFFPHCQPPPLLVKLVTAVAMAVTAFLNCYSVKMATRIQNICTFTKLGALAVIAIGGIVNLSTGTVNTFDEPFEGTTISASALAVAFYNGLWAFDGWNSLNFVTEEIKNPSRNLPLAIMIGIPLTTVCYVLANVGYLAVMSKAEILQSRAVAVRWGEVMLGPYLTWLMPVFVIVSTFGSANGCLFASGRLSYVAGREGHFPQLLGFISMKRLTPVPAIVFTVALAMCLLLPGDLGLLIDIFIFSSWFFYGLATVSLLILRYTRPHLHRPFKCLVKMHSKVRNSGLKRNAISTYICRLAADRLIRTDEPTSIIAVFSVVPIVVPVVVLLACFYLLLTPVIQNPGGSGSFTLLIIVLGLVAYFPFVHMNLKVPGMDFITAALQKLLCIVPTKSQ